MFKVTTISLPQIARLFFYTILDVNVIAFIFICDAEPHECYVILILNVILYILTFLVIIIHAKVMTK